MLYNLRRRPLRDKLLDESSDFGSENNESGDCESSEHSFYSDDSSTDSDEEMENVSLEQRLLKSGSRGRPVSKLRGKDGFVWNAKSPKRRSG